MADRKTLHFKHLETFKRWLIKNNWEMKPLSKSQYEVLRATKNGRWVIVYVKDVAKEHYSLTENSISVVNQWLRERKIRKQVCKEIRDLAGDYWTIPLKKYVDYDGNEIKAVLTMKDFDEILDQIQGAKDEDVD